MSRNVRGGVGYDSHQFLCPLILRVDIYMTCIILYSMTTYM